MKLLIKASKVTDGNGAQPIRDGAILVEDKLITKICAQKQLTPDDKSGADILSYSHGTAMPGFIEMHSHVHCSAEYNAYQQVTTETNETLIMRGTKAVRDALCSGVTTMRDLGSKNEVVFPIKDAIERCIIPGPRLIATGTPITTTGGHCHMFGSEADTSSEVVRAIRQQSKMGADWIKIMSTGGGFTPGTNVRAAQYDSGTLAEAVKDAERLGMKVAAHCHGTEGIKNCVTAGIHNLIHSSWLSANPDELYDYDPKTVDQIVEKGLYVDPTLALSYLNRLRGKKVTKEVLGGVLSNPERRFEILRDMWDRGVKFVTGMDSGMTNATFKDFAYIPEVMVKEMGLTPLEAPFPLPSPLVCKRSL
jgi:imidazolonepropionase-like amidohydrolase